LADNSRGPSAWPHSRFKLAARDAIEHGNHEYDFIADREIPAGYEAAS